jgi:hypothetical protein
VHLRPVQVGSSRWAQPAPHGATGWSITRASIHRSYSSLPQYIYGLALYLLISAMSQSGPSPGKEPELAALTYCKDGPVPPKPAVVVLEIETYAVLHFRDSVLLESQAFVGATAQAVLMSWLVGIARYKPFQLIIGLGLTFSQVLATVRAGELVLTGRG